MLHKAWNSKGEMPYCFPRSSIKFQGHTVQNITDFDPNWAFPDYRPVAAFKSLRFAFFFLNSKIWSFGKFFKFLNLTLSCFHLGSNKNWSIVWVVMGRWGVSSERKRSSCSSFPWKVACLSDCKMGLFWTLMHCAWLTPKHRETQWCAVSIVATDALVLKHLAISIHNAD